MRDRGSDRRERTEAARDAPEPGAHFAMVPWALQDTPGVDAGCIAAYAALVRYADFGQSTGARVSDAVAAVKAGLSRRAFIDRRERLRKLGWISWETGKAKGGVNVYVVHRSRGGGVQEAHTPGVQEVHTPCAPRAEGGVHQVHTTKSQLPRATTENQELLLGEAGASPGGAEYQPPTKVKSGHPRGGEGPTFRTLMGLVRRHLYVPDGHPPAGYSEQRDGSVLKQLLERGRSMGDVAVAIEGVALLRDQPGLYGEDGVEWLGRPGTKLTCRVLLKRCGVQSVWVLATRAYWTRENRRPSQPGAPGRPTPISALLPKGPHDARP